jgi:hypothetical protein
MNLRASNVLLNSISLDGPIRVSENIEIDVLYIVYGLKLVMVNLLMPSVVVFKSSN